MSKTRIVISESAKRKAVPKGTSNYYYTEQVVYKTPIGKEGKKTLYMSETKHEISKSQKR